MTLIMPACFITFPQGSNGLNLKVLGFRIEDLGEYMIIGYLDPWGSL